jgi:hypothetical protein
MAAIAEGAAQRLFEMQSEALGQHPWEYASRTMRANRCLAWRGVYGTAGLTRGTKPTRRAALAARQNPTRRWVPRAALSGQLNQAMWNIQPRHPFSSAPRGWLFQSLSAAMDKLGTENRKSILKRDWLNTAALVTGIAAGIVMIVLLVAVW